jgi:hypothetical protein
MVRKCVVGSGLGQVSCTIPVFTSCSSWVESQLTSKHFDFGSSPETWTSRTRNIMHVSVASGVDSLFETVSGSYSWCKRKQFYLDCCMALTMIVRTICDPLRYQRKNIFWAVPQSKCSAGLFQVLELIKCNGVFILLFRLLTAAPRSAR